MKRSIPLMAACIVLAAATTASALSPRHVALTAGRFVNAESPNSNMPSFVGFLLDPFSAAPMQETSTEEAAPRCATAARDCGEGWQSELVAESLKSWQVLCKKGRLGEAEQLANMLVSLQPDNPQVRAACTVTQWFKSMAARMTPDMSVPDTVWQMPLPRPVCEQHTGSVMFGAACSDGGLVGSCAPKACPLTCAKSTASCTSACAADACARGCCGMQAAAKGSCCCASNTACCCKQAAAAKGGCCCANNTACCCKPAAVAKGGCCCMSSPACCCAQQSCTSTQRIVCEIVMPHLPGALAPAPMVHGVPFRPQHVVMPHPVPVPRGDVLVARNVEIDVKHRGQAQQARLATPHLDAQCERITCVGGPDRVVLEGHVRLTYKKGGQQVQIVAERVTVNVKEETFTVDGAAPRSATLPAVDVRRSIHVVPVPPCPED